MFTENRMKHSLAVAKKMKKIVEEHYPDKENYASEMFFLGFVHDMGYEFTSIQSEHAECGGIFLKENNYKYWKEVYYHGKSGIKYESKELKLLNEIDLTINSEGKEVSVKERLKDVKHRYGEDSFQYQDFKKLAEELNFSL